MPIIYNNRTKEFHLQNQQLSYLFCILENGHLGQLYYGKKLMHRENFSHLFELSTRDMAPYLYEGNSKFSLEHIKQEYPTFGTGDMRYPAFEIEKENGSRVVDFVYVSHRIYAGKQKLSGLPATYVEREEEASSLELLLEDKDLRARLLITYTIYEGYGAITKNVRFICSNPRGITLLSAMSGCMDLPDKEYELMTLSGAWARERHVHRRPLEYGVQSVYSMRGCSSHQHNPFLALARPGASEDRGEVLGFSLVYSGSFLAQVEVDNYDVTRVLMGIHPGSFRWKLEEGEEFQTPELVMAYSDSGLNGMSQIFHSLYRTRLARGEWRDKPRPVLINNWEATYFQFNEEKILKLAQMAADLGVELFVLDDGWFGKRNDATSSLGDWYPNLEKLPGGIAGLAKKIQGLGLDFGIWIEPEMVSKDSDLYRSHPDWLFAEEGTRICHSRNQYVLDMSRQEVRDYLFSMIDRILGTVAVSYIKWDMNRSFSDIFSNGGSRDYQGQASHRYILGVYELYDRLTGKYPHILFESCASGGARFDPGMLYYAPQGWISDDTDAVERLKIQYGTSMVYPLSSMGSHVSASPNHQLFRTTSMDTRANVAYFGTFGYELDLNQLSKEELEQIRKQIIFMKKYRGFIQSGSFYRLESPFGGNVTAWMVVSEDKKEALVGYYRLMQPVNGAFQRLKLQGLLPEPVYRVSSSAADGDWMEENSLGSGMGQGGENCFYGGDELMQSGLMVSDFSSGVLDEGKEIQGDYMSRLFLLKSVD